MYRLFRFSKHLVEYISLRILQGFVILLPSRWMPGFAKLLGAFAWNTLKIRKQVVLTNLQQALPHLDEERKKKTGLLVYQNFAQTFIEFLKIPALNDSYFTEKVTLQGIEYLKQALNKERGVVLVSLHMGNWEYVGGAMCKQGFPLTVIYQKQNNPLVNGLIERYRHKLGMEGLARDVSPRKIISTLRQNRILAFVVDQDAGPEGLFVDFLGRPASTARGPAVFTLKTGASMILLICLRQKDGTHLGIFKTVEFDHHLNYSEENLREITQIYTSQMEEYIKHWPEQWFWLHRRWKSKPESKKNKLSFQ